MKFKKLSLALIFAASLAPQIASAMEEEINKRFEKIAKSCSQTMTRLADRLEKESKERTKDIFQRFEDDCLKIKRENLRKEQYQSREKTKKSSLEKNKKIK